MNNIEELKSAYRDVELTARNMRGKPEEYRVVTGFCPVNVVEMQAQKIQALIAQLEEAQKESAIRLEAIEQMRKTVAHNVERAQTAEAALSAANEKLKGEQVPVFEVEMSCGHWLNMGPISGADLSKLPDGINKLFTSPQKPVVLSSSTVMSRAYVVQAIKAAGFTVEGE
ncbi:TPA: hypothetical protein ACPZLC_004531 [Yersinia enterocolitica]|uniref:hypothetical protein n=1 Tax=Yersinia enterocolitica TaxID=630 RepID=UPI003CFD4616